MQRLKKESDDLAASRAALIGKSMIYLIGGAPRVGKSTIAKMIADYTKAQVIPTEERI